MPLSVAANEISWRDYRWNVLHFGGLPIPFLTTWRQFRTSSSKTSSKGNFAFLYILDNSKREKKTIKWLYGWETSRVAFFNNGDQIVYNSKAARWSVIPRYDLVWGVNPIGAFHLSRTSSFDQSSSACVRNIWNKVRVVEQAIIRRVSDCF